MTIIQKRVKLVGAKGEEEVDAVFDSGSTYSCIRPELAQKLETVLRLPEPMEFSTAEKERKLVATECIRLNFHFNGLRFSDEFMLIPRLAEPVIIGAKTLQAWRMKLDFEREEIIVDPRVTKLRLLRVQMSTAILVCDRCGTTDWDFKITPRADGTNSVDMTCKKCGYKPFERENV